MEKKLAVFVFALILLTISGVVAESAIQGNVQDFVKKVAEKKGVSESDINNVSQVDFSNLPKEVNLENIDNTSLALYKVDTKSNPTKPVFIISANGENIQKITQTPPRFSVSYLAFGLNEKSNVSSFLATSAGAKTGAEKGYVMTRSGSITGVSTNIEVLGNGLNPIKIIIYKNGVPIGLGNAVDTSLEGVESSYATQSTNIATFSAGDVISASVETPGVSYQDATVMVELTTEN